MVRPRAFASAIRAVSRATTRRPQPPARANKISPDVHPRTHAHSLNGRIPIADRNRCSFCWDEAWRQRKLRHESDRSAGGDRQRQSTTLSTSPRDEARRTFQQALAKFHSSLHPSSHSADPNSADAQRRTAKNPVDVLHVQFTAPPFCPCPVVVSIHDLSFEHLPQTFNRRSRTQLRLTVRHSARRAARILTLSEHTRSDIIETYGIEPERITAIPLAAPAHFGPVTDDRELQRVRHTYGIDGDYILSVGSIQPRKNLARLVKAYASLRGDNPADKLPKLVLVGKCAWLYDETLRALEETGSERLGDSDRVCSGSRFAGTVFRSTLFCLSVVLRRIWFAAAGGDEMWRAGDRRQPNELAGSSRRCGIDWSILSMSMLSRLQSND